MGVESDDLDRLADELTQDRETALPADPAKLEGWLEIMAARGASDLLLVAGEPPALRVDGLVMRTSGGPVDGTDIEQLVVPALPAHARRAFLDSGIADASLKLAGVGRFRVNMHRERGRPAAAIRMLPRS